MGRVKDSVMQEVEITCANFEDGHIDETEFRDKMEELGQGDLVDDYLSAFKDYLGSPDFYDGAVV